MEVHPRNRFLEARPLGDRLQFGCFPVLRHGNRMSSIWGFPETGVPTVIIHFNEIFSINTPFGVPPFEEIPIDG